MTRNAGRKGRRLGPYRGGRVTPVYISLVPDDELSEMARAMCPTTPLEHLMTRVLLGTPVEWLTISSTDQ